MFIGLYAGTLLSGLSCAGDPAAPPAGVPQCLAADQIDLNCLPLYPPEFSEIFQRTLNVTCASAGVSCHGQDGSMGGLVLANMSDSYDALLGRNSATRRVIPGDPACSGLMVRLDSPGKDWSMPPGTPLDERARCAIRRWIAAGAPPPPLDGGR